jgi:probable phosphoglycerate mutase
MAEQVILIRHCEEEPGLSPWPRLREMTEWQRTEADRPLTPSGVRQAGLLADRLALHAPGALWTSPLRRARETSRPIAERLGLDPKVDPELAEVRFGRPPGVDSPLGRLRLPRRAGYVLMRSLWLAGLTGGVDGPDRLSARARRIATRLESAPQEPAVVTHGVVLVYLLSVMVHPQAPPRPRRGHLPSSGEMLLLEPRRRRWRIAERWTPA